MIVKKIPVYIGLLHADGTEPTAASGYARVPLGKIAFPELPYIPLRELIAFPDVKEPGYGYISDIALFDAPEGIEALWIWKLPELVDIHEGVVPLVYDGKLSRGMEVQARAVLRSADLCNAGGG